MKYNGTNNIQIDTEVLTKSYLTEITFVIESLILSEKMRDPRLTNLDQDDVENLAKALYLTMEHMRSEGNGYMEMTDAANKIIDERLNCDDK